MRIRLGRHVAVLAALCLTVAAASACDYVKQTVDRVRPSESPAANKSAGSPGPAASPSAAASSGGRGERARAVADPEVLARAAECRAQVNALAVRPPLSSDKTVLGRQGHYSETYGRCFMQVSHTNPEAKQSPELLPSTYYELWDVANATIVSVCTDGRASGNAAFCNVEGLGFVACDVCQTFVKERMTK
jgi:hypothetical protein